jgi:hypothetical protein
MGDATIDDRAVHAASVDDNAEQTWLKKHGDLRCMQNVERLYSLCVCLHPERGSIIIHPMIIDDCVGVFMLARLEPGEPPCVGVPGDVAFMRIRCGECARPIDRAR